MEGFEIMGKEEKQFKNKYPELCKLAEENYPTQEDIVGCSSAELGEI